MQLSSWGVYLWSYNAQLLREMFYLEAPDSEDTGPDSGVRMALVVNCTNILVKYYKLEHGTVGLTFPCYQSSLAPGQVTQHKGSYLILWLWFISYDSLEIYDFSNFHRKNNSCCIPASPWDAYFDPWMSRYVLLRKDLETNRGKTGYSYQSVQPVGSTKTWIFPC